MFDLGAAMENMIPIVGAVALFSFLAIASWGEQRRREREAYYRSEVLKKLSEASTDSSKRILDLMQEEKRGEQRRRGEALKLGGLITAAVGLGLAIFLKLMLPIHEPVWAVGFIPLFIGVSLLVYALVLRPRSDDRPGAGAGSGPATG